MKLVRKVYETRAEKWKDFAIGVGVFIGLNLLLYILSLGISGLGVVFTKFVAADDLASYPYILSCLFYPLTILINIAASVYFFLTRTWIGIGMLGTFGLLLILGLILSIIIGVICFSMGLVSG